MNEKTVAEFAKELDVSVQAVYKKIKQFKPSLNCCLSKGIKGETLINKEGQAFLKDKFKLVIKPDIKPIQDSFNKSLNNSLIENLEKQINILSEENKNLHLKLDDVLLQNKEQSNQIFSLAQQMVELTQNNQVLLKNEQEKNILLSENHSIDQKLIVENKKKKFWHFFKK